MVKSILQTAITVSVGLVLFLFFQIFSSLPTLVGFLMAMIAALLVKPHIDRFWQMLCNKISLGKYAKIDQELDKFDQTISQISHYHELFPQFYQLFNVLLPEKTWLFYVFENSGFRFIEYDTSLSEESLPIEIDFKLSGNGVLMIDLTKLQKMTVREAGFPVTSFLDHHLDTLVIVRGKNQTVALLFVRRSNLEFLRNGKIRKKTERILTRAGQFLESTALFLDVIQRNLEIKKLFEVSKKLLTSLDTDEILDFLLDSLGEVVLFDAGVIFLIDHDSKKLIRKVSKGYEDDLDLTLKLGQGACGWVAETRQISLIADVEQAEHYYPIRPETCSQISVPLLWQQELMGVLSLESDVKGHFTTHSLELLKLFANQAAMALHNARHYEISMTKKLLEHELLNAGKVQKVLLPQRPPHHEKLNISFAHIPSKIVSGDLFDLASVNEDLLGLVIGDVSGKGAAAAIMMSLVLAGFRAYKKSHLAVCEVVARLNNLLEESVSEGKYATLFYSLISTKENTITYTNAGHNPPILFRSDGRIETLTIGGIVLGYLESEVYKQTILPFNPGDLLLSYTDGITEALNQDGLEFGENRLRTVLQKNIHMSSYDLKNVILDEVNSFTQSGDISDDRTLVIVKYI